MYYKYGIYYYIKRDGFGVPAWTLCRVHDYNDTHVQVSIRGELQWMTAETFSEYFIQQN